MVSTHLRPQDVSIFGDEPFNVVDFHILNSRPYPIRPKLTSGGLGDFTHTEGKQKRVKKYKVILNLQTRGADIYITVYQIGFP